MAAQFDTHKYVRALREAGMPEPQAEKIVEAINDAGRTADLATKADINILKVDINLLKDNISVLKDNINEIKDDIKDLRGEFKHLEERFDGKLKTEIADLIKWIAGFVIGAVIALTGIFIALIKLLIPGSS
jgi:predicted  nucleic acid-binding Zn-ribbon protein